MRLICVSCRRLSSETAAGQDIQEVAKEIVNMFESDEPVYRESLKSTMLERANVSFCLGCDAETVGFLALQKRLKYATSVACSYLRSSLQPHFCDRRKGEQERKEVPSHVRSGAPAGPGLSPRRSKSM